MKISLFFVIQLGAYGAAARSPLKTARKRTRTAGASASRTAREITGQFSGRSEPPYPLAPFPPINGGKGESEKRWGLRPHTRPLF